MYVCMCVCMYIYVLKAIAGTEWATNCRTILTFYPASTMGLKLSLVLVFLCGGGGWVVGPPFL